MFLKGKWELNKSTWSGGKNEMHECERSPREMSSTKARALLETEEILGKTG